MAARAEGRRAACHELPRPAEVLGALSATQQEFYRRIAVPYEDRKRKENGEVFVTAMPYHEDTRVMTPNREVPRTDTYATSGITSVAARGDDTIAINLHIDGKAIAQHVVKHARREFAKFENGAGI